MTPLGKQLVFYLKYMAEMNHLYGYLKDTGAEEPDLSGLDNGEQIREMVSAVGNAASNEAAVVLELCGKEIESQFTGFGSVALTNKKSRKLVKKYWSWGATVNVTSVPGGSFWCGLFVSAPAVHISMENDACGVVVPYLWSKGGRKGEDAVWKILDGWPHSRGDEGLVKQRGSVALACIPIKAQPPGSFDVDRDKLLAEVMKTIARIGAEQTKAIASFAAGLKESDES